MAASEPQWFKPVEFCREVLNFTFREFEFLPPGTVESLNEYSEECKEAVISVGRAVFVKQVIMRNKIRILFMECIDLAAISEDFYMSRQILSFMSQSYLHSNIINSTVSCFAIVAELILFMDEFGHPIPYYWHPMPWVAIYESFIRKELAEGGGWEALLEKTREVYTSNWFTETSLAYRNNTPITNAERGGRVDWPDDPEEFLALRFRVAPRSTTLAMKILRKLYCYIERLTPIPGAGAHDMRLMLGFLDIEDDDGFVEIEDDGFIEIEEDDDAWC